MTEPLKHVSDVWKIGDDIVGLEFLQEPGVLTDFQMNQAFMLNQNMMRQLFYDYLGPFCDISYVNDGDGTGSFSEGYILFKGFYIRIPATDIPDNVSKFFSWTIELTRLNYEDDPSDVGVQIPGYSKIVPGANLIKTSSVSLALWNGSDYGLVAGTVGADGKSFTRTSSTWTASALVNRYLEFLDSAGRHVAMATVLSNDTTVLTLNADITGAVNVHEYYVCPMLTSDASGDEGTWYVGRREANSLSTFASLGLKDALSIVTAHISDGAVTTSKIADDAITTAKIADDAITYAKILDGTIDSGSIKDGAIVQAKLANDSVTVDKIFLGSVTEVKLASNSVTNAKIEAGAVTTDKIGANQINASHLNSLFFGSGLSDDTVTSGAMRVIGFQAYNTSDVTGLYAMELGTWDMDATAAITGNLPAYFSAADVISISCMIYDDSGNAYTSDYGSGDIDIYVDTSDTIHFTRAGAGFFDSTSFNDSVINRGRYFITYRV